MSSEAGRYRLGAVIGVGLIGAAGWIGWQNRPEPIGDVPVVSTQEAPEIVDNGPIVEGIDTATSTEIDEPSTQVTTDAAADVAPTEETPVEAPIVQEVAEVEAPGIPAPSLDTFRVESDGQAVLAGRAGPGAVLDILVGGNVVEQITADVSGSFFTFLEIEPSDSSRSLTIIADPDGEAVKMAQTLFIEPFGIEAERSEVAEADIVPGAVAPILDDSEISEAAAAEEKVATAEPVADSALGEVATEPPTAEDTAATAIVEPEVTADEPEILDVVEADIVPDAVDLNLGDDGTTEVAAAEKDVANAEPEAENDLGEVSSEPPTVADTAAAEIVEPEASDVAELAEEIASNTPVVEELATITSEATDTIENPVSEEIDVAVDVATKDAPDDVLETADATTEVATTVVEQQPEAPETEVAQVELPAPSVVVEEVVETPEVTFVPRTDEAVEVAAALEGTFGTSLGGGDSAVSLETVATDRPTTRAASVLQSPTVLIADETGVRLMPTGSRPVLSEVALDSISYDSEGEVLLAGRASTDGFVQVYIDNQPVTTSRISSDLNWSTDLPEVDTGIYTLRIDELDAEGTVVSRIETPFKREEPETVAAVMAEETAKEGFEVAVKTVQPGSTLWAIAREKYGRGILYVSVYEANSDLIRDPDLIYPGQIFVLPELEEELEELAQE